MQRLARSLRLLSEEKKRLVLDIIEEIGHTPGAEKGNPRNREGGDSPMPKEYEHFFEMRAGMKSNGNRIAAFTWRDTPEFKERVYRFCREVIQLDYSDVERLLWRRLLHNYEMMPQVQGDTASEISRAADDVMEVVPFVKQKRTYAYRRSE